MNINFKELLKNNLKVFLFCSGMIGGSLLSMILMHFTRNVKLVELDLNRIIKSYSVVAIKLDKSPATINKEFKEKFNHAMEQISLRTIVVSKGYLLSTHEASVGTKHFIENMEIHNIDEQKSN
ncbi:MAG: hypothetical protein ACR2HS_03935 [Gammaproteobacteria bacterium]